MAETPPPPGDPAAKRALRRAGVHFVRAAIEMVAGVGVLIEELRGSDRGPGEPDAAPLQHIELDEEPSGPGPEGPEPGGPAGE